MIQTGSTLVDFPCRHSWRKWLGSNQMLTKSPRHTKGRLPWSPRTSLRSQCLAKEELEVCIPQVHPTEHDPSHLVQCWVTAGWRYILILYISAPGMISLFIYFTWLHGEGVCFLLTGKRSPTQTMYASATQAPIETKNPRVNLLVTKWQHVWLLALDRRRKLNDAMDRLEEVIQHKPTAPITADPFFLGNLCLSGCSYQPFYFLYS